MSSKEERTKDAGLDPITLEIIGKALSGIAEEMGITLIRTSYSQLVKESRDSSCAIFDNRGQLAAQAEHIPVHLGSMKPAIEGVLKSFSPNSLSEGDIIMMNDPYSGGQHLPDLILFKPVFYRGDLVSFVCTLAHHLGIDPGGSGVATSIHQEGLRIPPAKLYEGGTLDNSLLTLLLSNVRTPDQTRGDLNAQIGSLITGERELLDLFAKHGKEVVYASMEETMSQSEKKLRLGIERIPGNGEYYAEDYVDDDGISNEPVKIAATLNLNETNVNVSFKGSDGQTKGHINSPFGSTFAAVSHAIRLVCIGSESVPQNEGCYRPIRIQADKGLVVNPNPPAAVGNRMPTYCRIFDVVMQALAKVVPEKCSAGSYGSSVGYLASGMDRQKFFLFGEGVAGGLGARFDSDGPSCTSFTNARNSPIEAVEIDQPLFIEKYEMVQDSGGAGRFRGGLAERREIKALAEVEISAHADRHVLRPYGLDSGQGGSLGRHYLRDARGIETILPSKFSKKALKPGDTYIVVAPGGGAYGDPLTRNPELVVRDVIEERISKESALSSYAVVLDDRAKSGFDLLATESLRRMRHYSNQR